MATAPRAPAPTGPRAVAGLVTSRGFGPYFAGNALSATGVWFHNLAASIFVFRETGSELLLGVLAFSQFVPVLLLAPWAGSAADRVDRRRIVLAAQAVAGVLAAALAVLAWADHASVAVVIGISLGLGVTQAFSAPAASALLPALVEPHELPSAVALNSMTYNLARAAGPALAAAAVTALGIPAAFAVNAFSYVALIVGIAVVRPRPVAGAGRAGARLRESLAMLRREPRLAVYLVIVMLVGFASDPINTLAPAYAAAFGRPDTDAGFIIGVFGAGAVTAAIAVTGRVAGSARRLAFTLAMLGGGVIVFSLTPWLGPAMAVLFVAGFGYLASNTSATSRLQLEVAEAHRGRVMALWTVAFLGLRPVASLIDGAVADAFGVRAAGVVVAAPALAAAALLVVLGRGRVRAAVGVARR